MHLPRIAYVRFAIGLGVANVAAALTGCAGSGGSGLPSTAAHTAAATSNAAASNAAASSAAARAAARAGVASAAVNPALIVAPRLLDSGAHGTAAPAATYVGYHVNAADSGSAMNAASDGAATSAGTFAAPLEPGGRSDTGSHRVTISGLTSREAIITSNQRYDLTYAAGRRTLDYTDIIAHFSVSGGARPSAVSAEYVGGAGASAFDVRAACASPAQLDATFNRFTCPIPAFGAPSANSLARSGAIIPGAAGAVTPNAAKIYFVLTYAATPAAGSSTVLGIDNVYAATCAGSSCAARAAAGVRGNQQTTPDWPAYGQTDQHNAYVNDPNMTTSVAPTMGVNWMMNLYDADLGSPIAAFNPTLGETLVYSGNERGDVFAFNESNGQAIYSTSVGVGDSLRATPLYTTDGSLWVGTNFSPTLYKLTAATGQQQCANKTTLQIQGSPEVATPPNGVETIYDSDIDGYLSGPWFATNEATCAQIFSFTGYRAPPAGPWASTAYALSATGEGLAIVGTADPDTTEYAIDAETGKLVWEYKAANPYPASFDIGTSTTISPPGNNGFADGVCYFSTELGILYALDLTTGKLIWQYNYNAAFGTKRGGRSAAALDGNVLVLGYAQGVIAVNATTGALIWNYVDPTGTEGLGGPAIVGPPGSEVVAATDVAGQFHILSLATGAPLYQYQTGGFIAASPAYINGHFIITSGDGFVYDFAPGGANAPLPSTTLSFPAQGATVPNPNGNLIVTGSASDSASIAGVNVAVQSGGPAGPWYNAATGTWNSAPVSNFVAVASPGSPSSTWQFPFPVPPAGGSYEVFVNAVDSANLDDVHGALSIFAVSPSAGISSLELSAPYIAPGNSLIATATAFQPGETVAFTLLGVTLATAQANPSGTATGTLPIPATATLGLSSIVATGQTSGDTSSAPIAITNAWAQYGEGPAHSFFEANDTILKHELSVQHGKQFLQLAWYFGAGGAVESSPIILDGVAYFGNDNGVLSAVATATSAPVWSFQALSSQPIRTAPAIDPTTGLLLFTCTDGNLYTLNASTGNLVSTLALGGTLTSPTIDNGIVYVANANGTVWALNETTNAVVWQAQLGGAVAAAPAIDTTDNAVVVGDATGAITALAVKTGHKRWSVMTGGSVNTAPAIADGVAYAGSTDGHLYAIKASSGAAVFTVAVGSPVTSNVAVDMFDHIIEVGTQSGEFLAFAPSGKQVLKNLTSTSTIVSVAAVASIAVGLRADGTINLFRPGQLGATLFVYQTNAGLDTTAAIVNGAVFVGAEDGGLYALTSYGKPPINVVNPAKARPAAAPAARLPKAFPLAPPAAIRHRS